MKEKIIVVHTDGACNKNPGPGGWGAHIKMTDGEVITCSGHAEMTTNQRMEMQAVISAVDRLEEMRALKSAIRGDNTISVNIVTTSKYVIDGITDWIKGWKRKGWKTSTKKDVANKDLWMTLDEINQKYDIHWTLVKGHNGHPENEIANQLAVDAIKK